MFFLLIFSFIWVLAISNVGSAHFDHQSNSPLPSLRKETPLLSQKKKLAKEGGFKNAMIVYSKKKRIKTPFKYPTEKVENKTQKVHY